MAVEVSYSSDPQRKRTAQRIMRDSAVTATLDFDVDGVCVIGIEGPLLHDAAFTLRHALRTDFSDHGVAGLLVDVQRSPALSIVRLGGLLEILSEFRVPLAVVLHNEGQCQLAGLLHNTLAHMEDVAYFTNAVAALDYVRNTPARPRENIQ